MKKSLSILFGIGLVSLVTGSAMAAGEPSAKFAATWTTQPGLESVAIISDADVDKVVTNSKTGYTLATIKVPQDKELLVGVSAEIGLVTDTSVKGRDGGTATATAGGQAYVTVFAVPKGGGVSYPAAPGQITLSKRVQALTATLAGVIQTCTPVCGDEADCDIVIAEDCVVTDEQIGLLQDTTAAHHFNFVLPDMPQGIYDIKAVFSTGARAQIDICDETDCSLYDPQGIVTGSATAKAIINKTMVTVQQVRAAQEGLSEITIIEP